MRHQVDGRKFGRNTSHRVALFRNMANSVILQEQVITTVQKAKEVRRVVDRLITLGKSGLAGSRRLAFNRTRNNAVVSKLFSILSERYQSRAGGYTRVLKLADRRWGDAAEMAVLELVDHPEIIRGKKAHKKSDVSSSHSKDETEKKEVTKHVAAPKDGFNRFRRMFRLKSKVKGGEHGSMNKTSAGGGGSKTGS